MARLGILLCLITITICGCGPSGPATFPVTGKVTFEDGTPVKIGLIEFRSADRTIARGKIEQDGAYSLTTFEPNDGALEGEHQVVIQQLIITEDLSFGAHDHGKRVPPTYADYSSSPLQAVVKPVKKSKGESNTVDFKLLISEADKVDHDHE
jgi:predicted small lipoprotein YifL